MAAYRFCTLILLTLAACESRIDRDIALVVAGGDDAADARQRLGLVRLTDVEPLIRAFRDESLPVRARSNFAQALRSLHLREPDQRVESAMIAALDDQHPRVRLEAVSALSQFGKRHLVEPVLRLLEWEQDDDVLLRIFVDLELLMNTHWTVNTRRMTREQRARLADIAVRMLAEDVADTVRFRAREWLEVILAEEAEKAHGFALQAELARAESILVAARDKLPDSKHINFKLGRFYLDYLDRTKGERILHDSGSLIYVPRLANPPSIDGDLSDTEWGEATRIEDFFMESITFTVLPAAPETEALIGYLDDNLYIGFTGYEESMEMVSAPVKSRDTEIWMDDHVSVLMDTDRDFTTNYVVRMSASGSFVDQTWGFTSSTDMTYDGGVEQGFQTDANHWYVELRIPLEPMKTSATPGTIWNFNIIRTRIGNRSENTAWKSTHWDARDLNRWGLLVFR